MDRNELSRLIEALQQGTVTVTFQKIDSDEIRVMPCTLNPIVLKANGVNTVIEYQGLRALCLLLVCIKELLLHEVVSIKALRGTHRIIAVDSNF